MEPDFSGWATKAGLKCTDGRVIMPDAFKHQDKVKVPLVWHHGHKDPENVLGHVLLENRPEGVYCQGFFNETPKGKSTKLIVQHGDVDSLSIWANQLAEKTLNGAKSVFHGMIREVSLVLAGANPEAKIDFVAHSAYDDDDDLEALIYPNIPFDFVAHSDEEEEPEDENKDGGDDGDEESSEEDENDENDESVQHADEDEIKNLQAIYDAMTDEQKKVVRHMVGTAIEFGADQAKKSEEAKHDGLEGDESQDQENSEDENSDGNDNEDTLTHQEGNETVMNTFDQTGSGGAPEGISLSHDQLETIGKDWKSHGSWQKAWMAHADEYGITDIDLLFPDAKALQNTPEFISRRMEWVDVVLKGTKHSPFAKVKTILADITADEARAKGYTKGNRKVEEVFGLLKRVTGPATLYKKQKLDRDDIIDITELDVVAYLKGEMRLMIEEEVARAILVGDGRSNASPDKVKDPAGDTDGVGIRSILLDHDLYSIKVEMAANTEPKDAVKELVRAKVDYRGTGKPTLFISSTALTDIMLEEDKFGRALYANLDALRDKLMVKEIVTVDLFDEYDNLYAIMVNLQDYTVGSNLGGQLTSFQDFDIDFNQEKFLQETRLSGALTRPYSAVVVRRAAGTQATATAPSFDGATDTITIPVSTGVSYFIDGEEVTGDVVITGPTEVKAMADDGYYIASGSTRYWNYTP